LGRRGALPAFVSGIAANLPRKAAIFLGLSADVVAIWARRRIASRRPFKASFGRAGMRWNLEPLRIRLRDACSRGMTGTVPCSRSCFMDVLVFRALALLGLALLVALAARRLRLPYTVGLVLAGTALAATRTNAGLALTHDLIFDVVLPPLLFEAALNLHWGDLKRDLVPVLALSTIGVALCAFVVAGGLFYGLGRPLESALVFGALISATDPIAVIALLRESGVGGRLRLLVEAESLVNDGAAAVLFALILPWGAHDPEGVQGPFSAAESFVLITGGGLVVGVLVGLVAIAIAGTSERSSRRDSFDRGRGFRLVPHRAAIRRVGRACDGRRRHDDGQPRRPR
jgi:hypothetical protein